MFNQKECQMIYACFSIGFKVKMPVTHSLRTNLVNFIHTLRYE